MTVVIQKTKQKSDEEKNNNNHNHSKIIHHIFSFLIFASSVPLALAHALVCMCLSVFIFVHLPFALCMTLPMYILCTSVHVFLFSTFSFPSAHWTESAFLLISNNIKCMKGIISQSASWKNNGNYNRTVDAHNEHIHTQGERAQYHANGHAKVIRLQLLDNLQKEQIQRFRMHSACDEGCSVW